MICTQNLRVDGRQVQKAEKCCNCHKFLLVHYFEWKSKSIYERNDVINSSETYIIKKIVKQ